MKKKMLFFIVYFLLFTMQINCAIGPVNGILVTHTKFAGEFNTRNDIIATKSAEKCSHTVMRLFSWGDSTAGATAKSASISRIATIDHGTTSVLGFFYQNYCTIVTGD